MKILFSNYFGYFSILLMGFLTLLLPAWIDDWILRALKRQDWISIGIFKKEGRFLKRFSVWCVALAWGLSWSVTGGFTHAIIFCSFLPGLFLVLALQRYARFKNKIARDFVSSLHALKGLLEVGTPFPQALILISQESSAQWTTLLVRIIRSFQTGKSLETNFRNLEGKSPEDWIFRSLTLLEKAYRKGLALSPLVESLIQVVELEFQTKERLKRLQKELWVQALFAAVVPYLLGAVCWTFQPEIMGDVFQSNMGRFLLVLIFLWEGIGLWILRQAIRFY